MRSQQILREGRCAMVMKSVVEGKCVVWWILSVQLFEYDFKMPLLFEIECKCSVCGVKDRAN